MVDGVVYVLMGEELECKWEIVRVQEQLGKVFELEDIYGFVIAIRMSNS